jgi:putative hydrolase of the HAD superfamily
MCGLTNKHHVFFDLDDTLWDFEKNSERVLRQLFDEFLLAQNLHCDFDVFYQRYKIENKNLWSLYYQKKIDKHFLRNHRFNTVFKLFGHDDYEENLLVTEQYLKRSPNGTVLKDNCVVVLDYLKQHYHLHIITNGFKEVQDIKLKASGIQSYFNHVIISEEHNLTKPDERIFRLAENLASTSKQHCVMIGDNLESDIAGALNAGWDAIHYSEQKDPNYNGLHVSNLLELKTLL